MEVPTSSSELENSEPFSIPLSGQLNLEADGLRFVGRISKRPGSDAIAAAIQDASGPGEMSFGFQVDGEDDSSEAFRHQVFRHMEDLVLRGNTYFDVGIALYDELNKRYLQWEEEFWKKVYVGEGTGEPRGILNEPGKYYRTTVMHDGQPVPASRTFQEFKDRERNRTYDPRIVMHPNHYEMLVAKPYEPPSTEADVRFWHFLMEGL